MGKYKIKWPKNHWWCDGEKRITPLFNPDGSIRSGEKIVCSHGMPCDCDCACHGKKRPGGGERCDECGKFMSRIFIDLPKDRYILGAGRHEIGYYCPDCGVFGR